MKVKMYFISFPEFVRMYVIKPLDSSGNSSRYVVEDIPRIFSVYIQKTSSLIWEKLTIFPGKSGSNYETQT
jgi:hypothetical protein